MPIKISILVSLITLTLFSCSNDGNITVRGSYPAASGEYLQVEMLNIAETQSIDSAKIGKNGDFKFDLELDHPELILVRNNLGQYINLLAFPGDNIRLDIPAASFREGYEVAGSEESEKIRLLVDRVNRTKLNLDSISDALDEIEDQEGPEAKQLISSYQQTFMEQKKDNIRFVIENLSSLASVYALYQRIANDVYIFNDLKDLQYFKIVSDSISMKYPGSTLVTSLANDVERRMKEYNNMLALSEISKQNIVEAGMIDLNIEDDAGDEQSLSSLKGKVVLLNFWASWDDDSRGVTRALKRVYDQYHSRGFEIYSVALDNNKNQWRNAIYFEEFPWINVCELTYPYSYASTVYNVTSLPANYLIDREGNIVARNLAGKALATHLDNLL
jgi:thiol-disulfide isomerase/thioredoxin